MFPISKQKEMNTGPPAHGSLSLFVQSETLATQWCGRHIQSGVSRLRSPSLGVPSRAYLGMCLLGIELHQTDSEDKLSRACAPHPPPPGKPKKAYWLGDLDGLSDFCWGRREKLQQAGRPWGCRRKLPALVTSPGSDACALVHPSLVLFPVHWA